MQASPIAQNMLGRSGSAHRPKLISAALSALCFFALVSSAIGQQGNTIGTVAGGGVPYTGVALDTFFPNPTGIAEDSHENVYVAAQYSYYLYEVNPKTGALSVVAGTGTAGFSGDGGPATEAQLSSPIAVGVDKAGNVYVVDANRIRVINTQSSAITVLGQLIAPENIDTVAGTGKGCPDAGVDYPSCGDTGPAGSATFNNPQGIYIDGSGNIFIADSTDQEIRFINTGSSTVSVLGVQNILSGTIVTVAGNGYECNTPGTVCGDGGSAQAPGAKGAKLDIPIGVITDKAGNLYIGDTRDQRIRCVANVNGGCPQNNFPNTTVGEIVTYAGKGAPFCTDPTGSCGDGPKLNALFHNPSGIWLDPGGNLYIADQWDNKIREVTTGANGKVITVCGTGTAGDVNGKCPSGVQFYGPTAIVIDSAGNAFVADSGNDLIRQGNASTYQVKTIAGSGVIAPNSTGAATSATLANPVDAKWDSTGTIFYIADNGNNIIRKVDTTSGLITVVAGNGHPSQACAEPPPPTCNGDQGPASSATLDDPEGIALDGQGNLYIADSTDSAVRVVNMQSAPITVATVTIAPGDIVTVAGQQGVECLGPATCGDGTPATEASVDYPIAVSVDTNGNVYISDYFIGRVRCVVNTAGGCPNTANPNPPVGTIVSSAGLVGATGFNSNGISGDKAKLNHPYGLGTLNNNLVFDDSVNNMVRCVANVANGCGTPSKFEYIYDYALNGQPGFSGDGQLAINATETVPQGLSVDPAGNVYVGGGGDLVVRRIDATTGNILTVAGNPSHPGNLGFGGDGGPSTAATLDNIGMSVNGDEELLIADAGNNRIRQVDMVPVMTQFEHNINFGTIPVGQSSPQMPGTIQNFGLATLSLGTTQLSDPVNFSIASNTCVNGLAPGPESGAYKSTCTVEVVFNPQSSGTFNATLTVNTGLGAVTFNLTGIGQ
jgi:sugar lactone lactonase YvrE